MFAKLSRFVAREIDGRAVLRVTAAAIVLALALAIAYFGTRSVHRDDLEIATSILVIGVLIYGIYAALNAAPPDRSD